MKQIYVGDSVKIKVVGVGGGGSNVVNRMIEKGIDSVQFISINTDNGAVQNSKANTVLQIGMKTTKGLGAGADVEKGKLSAEEDFLKIEKALAGCDMVFVAAGMGGGTGTGAAPVVADIAKRMGILTVAVVTKPFSFEGKKRMDRAIHGIGQLEKAVDSMIVIPNDNLKKVVPEKITISNAFSMVDDVLVQTVENIIEVIQTVEIINCDFADICSIIRDSGYMHTATGIASGEGRVQRVIEQIISSKLLGTKVDGAAGALLCITAPDTVGLEEIDMISSAVSDKADDDVNMIFGLNCQREGNEEIKAVLISVKGKR